LGVRFSPQDMWVNTLEQLAARIDVALGASPAEIKAIVVADNPAVQAAGKKSRGLLSRLFGGSN
jgi:hypothetical protein